MGLAGKTSTSVYWDEFAELKILAWTVKGFLKCATSYSLNCASVNPNLPSSIALRVNWDSICKLGVNKAFFPVLKQLLMVLVFNVP